jgi:tRNA 2-selenouridine synthase
LVMEQQVRLPVCAAAGLRTGEHDEIIDVRSPREFSEDHVPGAVNLPVLTDCERAEVGSLYHADSFAAKKLGAAYVSANIAKHLRGHLAEKPRDYFPLLYCWRGGQRSRAFGLVLREVGWKAAVVAGGYRGYRAHVRSDLALLCAERRFHVLAGLTGVGKTRRLAELARAGENVLDLEHLAAHRGSLLGQEPDVPQPSQKFFESTIWDALHRTDPGREVFVEDESRRVGRLRVPDALWQAMRQARVTTLSSPLEDRVTALLADYAHYVAEPGKLLALLPALVGMHSRAQVAEWERQARAGEWRELVASLLEQHYDPRYRASHCGISTT